MAAPDGLASFPDDLLSLVLDDSALSDALQLLQVNRRWRLAVLAHPVYWKWLRVACASNETPAGLLALFHHRLACADGRPVHINLAVKDPHGFLAAVSDSLAFVRELGITTPVLHGPAVMAALRSPAPELVDFRLRFTPSLKGPPYPVLDAGAFAGHAPLLTAAALTNVAIASDVPPCLSGLREINVGGFQWREDGPLRLPYLFDRCPRLTTLLMTDNVYMAPEDYSNATIPRRLQHLIFMRPYADSAWLGWLATLTAVPNIAIKNGRAEIVPVLADHVAGAGGNVALAFHLVPDSSGCFVAVFKSELISAWATDVERSVQAPLEYHAASRNDAFVGIVNLKERITSLVVQAAAWKHLISALPALPALKMLSLTEVAFERPIDLQPTLQCPRLEQLIFQTTPGRGEGPQTVSADVLAEFIQGTLRDATLPLRLLSAGFDVVGTSPTFNIAGPEWPY